MILLSGRIHKEKKIVLFELLEYLFPFLKNEKNQTTQELSYKECGFSVSTLGMLGLC